MLSACAFSACEVRNPVTERTELIKQRNDEVDRKFSTRAAQLVKRRWYVEGGAWYAKMPDGAVLRMNSPVIATEPIHVGRPFYSGWAGDVYVSALTWETRPGKVEKGLLTVRYRTLFKDINKYEIEIAEGPQVTRASATELAVFHAAEP